MPSLIDIVPAAAWSRVRAAAEGVEGARAVADSLPLDLSRVTRNRAEDPEAAAHAIEQINAKLKRAREAATDARDDLRIAELDALRSAFSKAADYYAEAVRNLVPLREILWALEHLIRTRGGSPGLHTDWRDESLIAPRGVEPVAPATDLRPAYLLAPGVSEDARCLAAEWDRAVSAATRDASVTTREATSGGGR